MDKRAGIYYSFWPNINEIKSFIAFHEEYSQAYNRVFLKRYISQAKIFEQYSKFNYVSKEFMEEIGVVICGLYKIDKNLSEEGRMTSSTCTEHHKPTAQQRNGSISLQSLKSALLSIECDPNINGSSSKNFVAINSGESLANSPAFQNHVQSSPTFRNNFKRNLDEELENVENNPPKKGKHNF